MASLSTFRPQVTDPECLERAFEAAFRIEVRQPIADTRRVLYLMERR